MQNAKLLLFVGIFFITGFILGRAFTSNVSDMDVCQSYLEPRIPIGQFDEMVSVDVIRNGDDIWIVDHKSGHYKSTSFLKF